MAVLSVLVDVSVKLLEATVAAKLGEKVVKLKVILISVTVRW